MRRRSSHCCMRKSRPDGLGLQHMLLGRCRWLAWLGCGGTLVACVMCCLCEHCAVLCCAANMATYQHTLATSWSSLGCSRTSCTFAAHNKEAKTRQVSLHSHTQTHTPTGQRTVAVQKSWPEAVLQYGEPMNGRTSGRVQPCGPSVDDHVCSPMHGDPLGSQNNTTMRS